MVRLFSTMSAVVIAIILVAVIGTYILSKTETSHAKSQAAELVAYSFALSVSSQLEILNRTLDKMAEDPEVLVAVTSNKQMLLDTVAVRLEKHFPDALRIRLLLPTISEPDQRQIPRMGFADLDMVRETFTKNQAPAVQGDKGADRHLAIARRIIYNNQPVGVILASINEKLIAKSLQKATLDNSYMELRQGKLALAVAGEKSDDDQDYAINIKVPNTDWEIHYQYEGTGSYYDLLVVASLMILCVLIVLLACFITYRKLSDILTDDLRSVMKAFKDMMSFKMQGSYPVELAEMNTAISTLAQYKRVLDSENKKASAMDDFDNLVISDDEGYELDDYFDPNNNKF